MNPTLVFVYDAKSGLFNALADTAHKIFSPGTYSCHLCALTHSNFRVRQEWRQFVESLGRPVEFLHADELRERYGVERVPLPAIFRKEDVGLVGWIGAEAINSCRTMGELERLILDKVSSEA